MKPAKLLLLLLLPVLVLQQTSCIKDDSYGNYSTRSPFTPPVPMPPTPTTTTLKVFAGQDIFLEYPADSCRLNGSFSFSGAYSDVQFAWKQVAGAQGPVIENSISLTAIVRGFSKGVFEFELTVKDNRGAESRDTVRVYVEQIGDNEVVFSNLAWGYPWYATLTVNNIYSFIPAGPIKVYVWRSRQPQWEEVPLCCTNDSMVKYEYFIETRPDGAGMYNYGSLNVFYYGFDTGDSPALKVVY